MTRDHQSPYDLAACESAHDCIVGHICARSYPVYTDDRVTVRPRPPKREDGRDCRLFERVRSTR